MQHTSDGPVTSTAYLLSSCSYEIWFSFLAEDKNKSLFEEGNHPCLQEAELSWPNANFMQTFQENGPK